MTVGAAAADLQPLARYRGRVEFRILGAVMAADESGSRSLGVPQQRKLLAVMLTDPGRVLGLDRLLEVLWPDGEPPENARRTAISYVSRLRASLGEGWVDTTDSGYHLDISSATVDAIRFEELLQSAADLPPERGVDVLDEALALWRGPVFGEFNAEWWALPMVRRLDELRLDALAQRVDLLTATGSRPRALAEIQSLVSAHPLRSAFVERLMLALHACGRTDEALRAFQSHRSELVDRTGLEPSHSLVELDQSLAALGHLADTAGAAAPQVRGYRIEEVIGEGTFGTVYRAVQAAVDREVAVKVLRAELADDRDFIHRFEAEAQLVARLEHPHVVPLYDYWRQPGGAYLVFRLLRGGTAEDALLSDGAMSMERATAVFTHIASALAAAHAVGIVHRDVKPANILFDDDGAAYLTDFGIATVAAAATGRRPPTESSARHSSGSPMYASPEQARDGAADGRADQYALAVTMWELLAGVAPFDGTTATEVIAAKLAAPLPQLSRIRPDLPARLDLVLARASAVHPDDRFVSVQAMIAAWHGAVSVRSTSITSPTAEVPDEPAERESAGTLVALPLIAVNPYKGLRPFTEADAEDFHGRSSVIDALACQVVSNEMTVVVGPSGSGKSSLVLAGLLPRLREQGSLVVTMTPGDEPWSSMSAALVQISAAEHAVLVSRDALREPHGLVAAAVAVARDGDLVIVIDQMEELWTLAADSVQQSFSTALADLEGASRVRVVVTIRADWFDRPLADPWLGASVARSTFGLSSMSATDLHAAIAEPLQRVGVRFEPGLIGRIVAEAIDQPGSLPLLQFALAELFDNRTGATITSDAYEAMGGLAGSVAHQAERLFDSLDAGEQASLRRVFARLVNVGDGGDETRRRARSSELTGIQRPLLDRLVSRRLLTVDRDRSSREPTVEIAHESLLRSWPRLRDWLDEDREWLRELRQLSGATRLWTSGGRDEADLYRGARLGVARELTSQRQDALTADEVSFLQSSERLADSERLAAEARAEITERQNRRLRRRLMSVAAVLLVAIIAATVAVVQSRRADDQATLARQRAREADSQREAAEDATRAASTAQGLAEQSASEAATARDDAEASAETARSAEFDTTFENLLNTSVLLRDSRQDLAALLALEAYRVHPDRSESALFSTFTRNRGFLGYRPVAGADALLAVAAVGVEGHVVALLDGGRVVELDPTGVVARQLGTLTVERPLRADLGNMIRVSQDGSTVVAGVSIDDSLQWQAFSLATGEAIGPMRTLPFDDASNGPLSTDATSFHGFTDAALSNRGEFFAVSGGPKGHELTMRVADGETVGDIVVDPPLEGWASWRIWAHTASVAFGPNDELYVGGPTGVVVVIDAPDASGSPSVVSARIAAPAGAVEWRLQVVVEPSGTALVTAGSKAMAKVDIASGTVRWSNRVHSVNAVLADIGPFVGLQPCRDLAVSVLAETVFCADDFGTIFAVALGDGTLSPNTYDRQTGITGTITVTSDGTLLMAGSYTSGSLAMWRLDGGGLIQRVVATESGSTATTGYDASGELLAYTPSPSAGFDEIINTETGPYGPDLEARRVFVFGWSPVQKEFWGLDSADPTRIRRFDALTGASVAGAVIDLSHSGIFSLVRDDLHHRAFLMWPDLIVGFDTDSGEVGPRIEPPPSAGHNINSIAASADGTRLLVSFWQGTRSYDATTGEPLDGDLLPYTLTVAGPNGLAVGSTADGRLYLFDSNSLETIAELAASHGYILQMAFSSDGSRLVVANLSDGVRVFDVDSREQLGDAIDATDLGFGWIFSLRPDGLELALPEGPAGVTLWNLDPNSWLDAACELAGRNLTPNEWGRYLADFGPYHETCLDGRFNPAE